MSSDGMNPHPHPPPRGSGLTLVHPHDFLRPNGQVCPGGIRALWSGCSGLLGVLSKWDVSKAYPLIGLGFVFTVAMGYLLGEEVTLTRVLGVALICAGVVLVGRS